MKNTKQSNGKPMITHHFPSDTKLDNVPKSYKVKIGYKLKSKFGQEYLNARLVDSSKVDFIILVQKNKEIFKIEPKDLEINIYV